MVAGLGVQAQGLVTLHKCMESLIPPPPHHCMCLMSFHLNCEIHAPGQGLGSGGGGQMPI